MTRDDRVLVSRPKVALARLLAATAALLVAPAACQPTEHESGRMACSGATDGWFVLDMEPHGPRTRLWGGCGHGARLQVSRPRILAQRHTLELDLWVSAQRAGRYGLRLDALWGRDPRFPPRPESTQVLWSSGRWLDFGPLEPGQTGHRTLRILQPVIQPGPTILAGRLARMPSHIAGQVVEPEDLLAQVRRPGWRADPYADAPSGWALVQCTRPPTSLSIPLDLAPPLRKRIWLRSSVRIQVTTEPACQPGSLRPMPPYGQWRPVRTCSFDRRRIELKLVCPRSGRVDSVALTQGHPPRRYVLERRRAARMLPAHLRERLRRARTRTLDRVRGRREWLAAADRIRVALRRAMHLPQPGTPPRSLHRGRIDRGRYHIDKLWIESVDGLWASAVLYRPDRPGPVPAVLHLLGHYGPGSTMEQARWLGVCLAEHGVAVLAVDNVSFANRRLLGRHRYEDHHFMGWWHLLAGSSPARVIYGEPIRMLDFLAAQPWVDRKRIGVTGSSGGGTASLYLAGLDERISAAAVLAAVSDWEHFGDFVGGDPEQFPEGLITIADFATLLALVAPRPLLVAAGRRDDLFPAPWANRSVERARRIWRLMGAAGALRFHADPDSHGLKPQRVHETVRFFLRTWGLVGRGPAGCGHLDLPNPREVRVPLPPPMPTFLDSARRSLTQARPSEEALARFLPRALGLPPDPAPTTTPLLGPTRRVASLPGSPMVLTLDTHRRLPGLLFRPEVPPRAVVLYVADAGRASAVATPPLIQAGAVVLALDLSGFGETVPTRKARYGLRRNLSRVHRVRYLEDFFPEAYLLVTGDSLPALRTREILMALSALRERYPGLPLGLVTQGPLTGFYGLLASAVSDLPQALLVLAGPRPLARDLQRALFPLPGQTLPGLLAHGDVSELWAISKAHVLGWWGCTTSAGTPCAWRPGPRPGSVIAAKDEGLGRVAHRWIQTWLGDKLRGGRSPRRTRPIPGAGHDSAPRGTSPLGPGAGPGRVQR